MSIENFEIYKKQGQPPFKFHMVQGDHTSPRKS